MRWVGLVVLAGCGSASDDTAGEMAPDLISGDPVVGEQVYLASCGQSYCHGADGSGVDSNAIDLALSVPVLTDAQLVDVIVNGAGGMTGVRLGTQETADVVAYCRQAFGGPPG